MKKVFLSQLISLLCFFSVFPQVAQTLDERIAEAVAKNLPEWKASEPSKPFRFARGGYSAPVIEAVWTARGDRKAQLRVETFAPTAAVNKNFGTFAHPFLMRGVIPPNRKIENLGDAAHLVETSRSVEIAFYKANLYVILDYDFPEARQNKTQPYYQSPAPKEEAENALKFARVVAEAIDANVTFTPCLNDFYRQNFPAETLEEKLSTAVQKGEMETIKSLLAKGANPNHIFADASTALHLAVRQGCAEIIQTLIAAKADTNARTAKGATPLMIAANYGDLNLVKYLVESGADVRAKDKNGRNAAFYVISIEQGIRPGFPPATIESKTAVIKYLVAKGLNLNERDTIDGDTLLNALLHSCEGDCKSLMNLLLENGADVNAANNNGETPVFKAVTRINSAESGEFVKILIARGADVNRKTKRDETAVSYLESRKRFYTSDPTTLKNIADLIELLKNAGATG